jgi:N-acetylneuraminic acid mutarotase
MANKSFRAWLIASVILIIAGSWLLWGLIGGCASTTEIVATTTTSTSATSTSTITSTESSTSTTPTTTGTTTSTSLTGSYWMQSAASAGSYGRSGHASAVFNNKLWMITGAITPMSALFITTNEVLSSSNGSDWIYSSIPPPFGARFGASSVVFDNKIWLIGGWPAFDVWYSSDGENWNQVPTLETAFAGRGKHTSIVFDGKIWVIGGLSSDNSYSLNDVWYSSNGANWTKATSSASFGPRNSHSSVVYNNNMWVIGGDAGSGPFAEDVWYSTNGTSWNLATSEAAFGPRRGAASVLYNNKMWMIAGESFDGFTQTLKNDAWYSTDGVNWTKEATTGPIFSARANQSSVVFNNSIWVLGGDNSSIAFNDVWHSENF